MLGTNLFQDAEDASETALESTTSDDRARNAMSPEIRSRALWIAGLGSIAWLGGAMFLDYDGSAQLYTVHYGAGALSLTLLLLAFVGNSSRLLTWCAQSGLVVSWVGIMLIARATREGESVELWMLALLPVASTFMSGTASGLIWLFTCVATPFWLNWLGSIYPSAQSHVYSRSDIAWLQLILFSGLLGFTIAARRVNEKYTNEVLTQRKLIAEQARELKVSLQAAEAANRTKGQFLATISHEMRTPLNGVIGLNGLLLNTPLNSEQSNLLRLARLSGEMLLHIINDLLDYSKVEAGRLELEPFDFSLPQVCHDAMDLLAEQFGQKGIVTRILLADDLPAMVHGDPSRLRQILVNLLGNALKFTEQGEVALSCMNAASAAADGVDDTMPVHTLRVRFEIRDTGIGIDEQNLGRLFQPFIQAEGASTTRKYGGTGLGLAISRQLVELMGGKIGVSSQPGQGSCFWLEIPFRVTVTTRPPSATGHIEQGGRLEPLNLLARRVLVVEDNPVNQLIVASMLRHLGCQPDIVGNGRQAIEALQRVPYDLVLMDCHMPEMDGYHASRAIRAQELKAEAGAVRHIPIVGMTAAALSGDRELCLRSGMDDYLSKPFRTPELVAILNRWLAQELDSR